MKQAVRSMGGAVCVAVALITMTACQDPRPGAVAAAPPERVAHVDSIRPIDEEIRRFRAALNVRAEALEHGVVSPAALVVKFMHALEAQDTAALHRLTLTPAEFIDLYYPHTHFTARPYEMSPQLLWFQLENYGAQGLRRALARFGGRPLGFNEHACEGTSLEGPNTVMSGCTVTIYEPGAEPRTVSLFGQMLGRDGAWKFISYGNGL